MRADNQRPIAVQIQRAAVQLRLRIHIVSETFPLEMRALAIAIFYALGTALGGIAGPLVFGYLIETGSRENVFSGYALGAILMIAAAVVQAIWGVAAERRPLV